MAIKILLLGDSIKELQQLENMIDTNEFDVVHSSVKLSTASEEVVAYQPDMVVMTCTNPNWVFRACQQIYLLHPNVITVMVSEDTSYDMAKKAIDSGANSYIAPLPEPRIFSKELHKVYTNEKTRQTMLLQNSEISKKADVITMFAPKGGVGKTMIATNLAVELSKRNAKVVILDLDLQFGDANMYLGLDSKDTIVELLQEQKVITIDNIRNYLTLHSSGVQLLSAPISPEYANNLSPALISPIISTLRNHYDYIIVDTSSEFSELNLFIMEESSTIIYVTGMDISLLNNSKKGLLLLDSLSFKEKVKLVVNRNFDGDITLRDIEKIMGEPINTIIPFEYKDSVRALNQGVPIVSDNKNEIATSIARLADGFTDEIENTGNSQKKSFLAKFNLKKTPKNKGKNKKKKSLFGGKK